MLARLPARQMVSEPLMVRRYDHRLLALEIVQFGLRLLLGHGLGQDILLHFRRGSL